MRTKELFSWIKERYSITTKKNAGLPKPWTKDPILQKFSFCSVHREDDRVTKWIAKNWRDKNKKDPNLFFAMTVARFINWPETMEELEYPAIETAWKGDFRAWGQHFTSVVTERQIDKEQVYGGAYTISTNGRAMVKHEYLLEHVFRPLWEGRGYIHEQMRGKTTLAAVHSDLRSFQGLGSFMAAQVIADVKYAQMKKAPDWWTWAASGPGSRRGLNRVVFGDATGKTDKLNKPWKESEWLETLQILHGEISGMAAAARIPQLHAQDLQNANCEFDKWCRVKNGEGRPRSLYPGAA